MIKMLFQGDSITDAGRDRSDCHNLAGYPAIVAEKLRKLYPQEEFEFIDLGISGDRSAELVKRYENDFRAVNPDIVSIMIGINDVWHFFADPAKYVGADGFENNMLYVLKRLKSDTDAKIIMLEPYLLPAADKRCFKMDLCAIIERYRALAVEFADEYVPLDGLFAKETVNTPWQVFSDDGVHPSLKGERFIADLYVEAAVKLIDEIICKRHIG